VTQSKKKSEQPADVKRIGIIGGTFDPIHYAHLAIAEEVYHALHLTRVLFVPAGQPPHKVGQPITSPEHRLAMLKLAIASNPHFAFSLVDMQRIGPSYTVDTLRLLQQEYGSQTQLYFILGEDILPDLPNWYDPAGVIAQAILVALRRPGYSGILDNRADLDRRLPGLNARLLTLDGPRMELSSSELRQRVIDGRPIKYQTPDAVEEYIYRHGLYHISTSDQEESKHATHTI
jgi:nicotinate-nucleotide adenylyltransferase